MQLTLFGATGAVGRRVLDEALARGHDVVAAVRDPDRARSLPDAVPWRVGDATRPDDVAALSAGQDAVVAATRPPAGAEPELVRAAEGLLAGLRDSAVRLLMVGGAGSLAVPGGAGTLAVDDPAWVPPAWREIAQACVDQYAACRAASGVDWTYLCPPALLVPGARTGRYRRGRDALVIDPDGASTISMEDFAVALVDELEAPAHRGARFTVGY